MGRLPEEPEGYRDYAELKEKAGKPEEVNRPGYRGMPDFSKTG